MKVAERKFEAAYLLLLAGTVFLSYAALFFLHPSPKTEVPCLMTRASHASWSEHVTLGGINVDIDSTHGSMA